MAGIEDGLATIEAYAIDNTHGYTLRERDYDVGTDCAGLGRLYAAAVEGVSVSTYPDCHSWDIADVLKARGWQVISFSESAKQRGDILARVDPKGGTGHVVVYEGGNQIVEAANDFDGKPGDSSGKEICKRSYYSYGYKYIVRPPADAGKVRITAVANGVYRMYNKAAGLHLYTADHTEAETLANAGWAFESVAYKSGSGAKVRRLYNPWNGTHMQTTNDTEGMDLACSGWVVEGVAYNAGTAKDLYRLYNPYTYDHVFTTDATERDSLVKAGWKDEGVAFKVN